MAETILGGIRIGRSLTLVRSLGVPSFMDVDHEIHEVTNGVRVTVAYLLRRKDHQSASTMIPRTLKEQEQIVSLQESLSEALRSENFMSDAGTIGFPCQHLYTNQQVFSQKGTDSDQPLTAKAKNNLKGRDHMVAQVATNLGLPIRLVPYLGHDYSGDVQACQVSQKETYSQANERRYHWAFLWRKGNEPLR